jgi:hypothetical protein
MKKIIIISVILVAGVWAMSMRGHCELESEQTHKVAKPIVEALAAYAKENGIPNLDNFDQIKEIPYELKPCSERPDLMECQVLKEGYYFQIGKDYYSIRMWGGERNMKLVSFGLDISHNFTICSYGIYDKEEGLDKYLQPNCYLNGKCAAWFRQ